MATKDDTAKEIFLRFLGDPFQMERERMLDDYRSFEVSKETEKLWASEYEAILLDHFRENTIFDWRCHSLFKLVEDFRSYETFLKVIKLIEKKAAGMDTFSKLRFCEAISEVISAFNENETQKEALLQRARHLTEELLQAALKEPITVHKYYKTTPHLPEAFEDSQVLQRLNKLAIELRIADRLRRNNQKSP